MQQNTRDGLIHLDTHVVAWLYEGLLSKFNHYVTDLMNEQDLFISPMVLVELQAQNDNKKLLVPAMQIFNELHDRINLKMCPLDFSSVSLEAQKQKWAKDPYDKIIVAQASYAKAMLITKDPYIHVHYPKSLW